MKPEGEGSTGPSRGEHRLTVYRAHATCHSSTCVRSIPTGPIFLPSSGQDLSRNAFVIAGYAFYENFLRRIFFRAPKQLKN